MLDIITRSATCQITCHGSNREPEFSSGFLIAKGIVLATRHGIVGAIEFKQKITLKFPAVGQTAVLECTASIIGHDDDLDACLLALDVECQRHHLPMIAGKPVEGSLWQSFAYPKKKSLIGHRLEGKISHLLPAPIAKVDMDLFVDADGHLNSYEAVSGAAVVDSFGARGMIRLRMDGSLGAISNHALTPFLVNHGISLQGEDQDVSSADPTSPPLSPGQLAERKEFHEAFERHLQKHPGKYIFLEGVHGIGKTTFCSEFTSETQLAILGTYSVSPPFGGSNAFTRSRPEVFFDWLSTTVGIEIFGTPPRRERLGNAEIAIKTRQLLQAFSEHCQSKEQQGLLFVDGLNEIKDVGSTQLLEFLSVLPDVLPPHVSVVLTGLSHSGITIELDGRVLPEHVLSLPPLTLDASSAFCWQELDEARANPAIIQQICRKAVGHPLYLRYLIRYANANPEDDYLSDFPVLDGQIERYYERIWEKLLQDQSAYTLVALIARLRPGIDMADFAKALVPAEADALIPTLNRVGHLLSRSNQPEIYHASFANFLIGKTAASEERIQTRLGEFCLQETDIPYCVLNVVHHLLGGKEASRQAAITKCDQTWVDDCTTRSVAPDMLLADIQKTLIAASKIDAVETLRLLLLRQRVGFRYDTLFTQSAKQIAQALIALERPEEALNHLIRYDALVSDAWSALQVSYNLLENGHNDHAVTLLQRILLWCEASYSTPGLTIEDFLSICQVHIQSCLLLHVAGQENMLKMALHVRQHAKNVLKDVLNDSTRLKIFLTPLDSMAQAYLLLFEERYISLEEIGRGKQGTSWINPTFLANLLLYYSRLQKAYHLPGGAGTLTVLFKDIAQVIEQGLAGDVFSSGEVVDTLIRLGAPHEVVALAEAGIVIGGGSPSGSSRAANGVDLDFEYIEHCTWYSRLLGFLDEHQPLPLIIVPPESTSTDWLRSFEDVLHAMGVCEGKLRRAMADSDETLRIAAGRHLIEVVLPVLSFPLKRRVEWERSYALPEALMPVLYSNAAEVLRDCYPEGVPKFLEELIDRSSDQFGLYSEGFCVAIRGIVETLQTQGDFIDSDYAPAVFQLLGKWRYHVLEGVENRHELIPELLELIVAFARSGATEEAERLFEKVLAVSMGPNWYKEDQFQLMTTMLGEIPNDESVGDRIAAVAGYLERASGEMTFGRYVRSAKSDLPGLLFTRKRFRQGCAYFMRQTCGDLEQLASDWDGHTFDAPTSRQGNRHLGGSLDEQQAILGMMEGGGEIPWRVRWALLETFHLGDRRHTKSFAKCFAQIVNEVGVDLTIAEELRKAVEELVVCEMPQSRRAEFVQALIDGLATDHRARFDSLVSHVEAPLNGFEEQPFNAGREGASRVSNAADENEEDDSAIKEQPVDLYIPGIFGDRSAITDSDALFATAVRKLEIGNRRAARDTLVEMLEVLQSGGWGIWSNPSSNAVSAEKLIGELSTDACDLIGSYSSLIQKERNTEPWRMADHLIARSAHLMNSDDRIRLFDIVLEHTELMIGDVDSHKSKYAFLSDEGSSISSGLEIFAFLLWLIDHPKWVRRDRAAVALGRLIRSDSSFDPLAVPEAFGMTTGYMADVLCGIYDVLSRENPVDAWKRIQPHLDLPLIIADCKHVSRLAALCHLADRAGTEGSNDAAEVARQIKACFNLGIIAMPDSSKGSSLPDWAECVEFELMKLTRLGVLNSWREQEVVERMKRLCSPLSIDDAQCMEDAISLSFLENQHTFSRWEAKVRFALNCALLPSVSAANLDDVCSALRIYNPSMPDLILDPTFSPHFRSTTASVLKGDYLGAIGDDTSYFLHYCGRAWNDASKKNIHLEAIAVLLESSDARIKPPSPSSFVYFEPTDMPDSRKQCNSQDTCLVVIPRLVFFGAFTPGVPLPAFAKKAGIQREAFRRITWRDGRSARMLGCPECEGAVLSVSNQAVHLPEGAKLAWCIFVDGRLVATVDEKGTLLQ